MIKRILFLFLTSVQLSLVAQQPSHYFIGQNELSGLDIYNLHQDQALNYWIATNNGLYLYDGYTFQKIESDVIANSSLFDFKEDLEGNLHCFNLKGQIFKISPSNVEVIFELEDSLMTHFLSYEFDEQNRLTVGTNQIVQVDEEGDPKEIYSSQSSTLAPLFKTREGQLISYNQHTSEKIIVHDGEIRLEGVNMEGVKPRMPVFKYVSNRLIAYDAGTAERIDCLSDSVHEADPLFWPSGEGEALSFYPHKSKLWVASLSGGMRIWDYERGAYDGTEFFSTNLVSSFLVDNEKNILLGTFGEGIIVVPNQNITDLKFQEQAPKVTQISAGRKGAFYLGTQDGRVFQASKQEEPKELERTPFKHIESLYFLEEVNGLLLNERQPVLLQFSPLERKEIPVGTIKKVRRIQKGKYIVASNNGLWTIDLNGISDADSEWLDYYTQISERCFVADVDRKNNWVYVSSVHGLKRIKNDRLEELYFEGQQVFPRDILYFNERIYIATVGRGMLVYEDGELIEQLTTEQGLLSNNVFQLEKEGGLLYAATDHGINALTTAHEIELALTKSDGLNSNKVIDFAVDGSDLWVVVNGGVQVIRLSDIQPSQFTPKLELASVLVNEKTIDIQSTKEFSYQQNKLLFELSAPSLRYQDDISYEYRLSGIDSSWQTNAYAQNKIEYKSLPAGEYTFEARARFRDSRSELVRYSFYIAPALWARWWFILIVSAAGFFLIFFAYRYQLNRQQKAAELQKELIASKLTAIQSQMNPHFIFNSLNSIQDLVLQKDDQNAYGYITKFATLVRKVLHQSGQDFIEIDEELKVLQVYLDLEQLRFKNDLRFELSAVGVEDIEIPPMIVQPFVENALKHGLLHKKGEKKLSVLFQFDQEQLVCFIEDNGIGRKKSAMIRERQKKQHDSFSIQSIRSRFEILEKLFPGELGLVIEDLYDEEEAIGTRVKVLVPYRRRF